MLKSRPKRNLFRDDAVGLNFEHIFNGAKKEHAISMFTPRRDPCRLKMLGASHYEISWPSEGSKWGMKARMVYDLSEKGQVDLLFECTPMKGMYPLGFAAMMWASYMRGALDRRIHFWGREGDRTGWVAFGEDRGERFETGTVSCADVPRLPFEKGAQTLNLIEHREQKFITPFYYGLMDADGDLKTTDDKLLYLVLFDRTEPIRFAMWNFIRDESGAPDTHSPAWDWQYVIRKPEIGKRYGYRARIVVEPFRGKEKIWQAYRRWGKDLGVKLPSRGDDPSDDDSGCRAGSCVDGERRIVRPR